MFSCVPDQCGARLVVLSRRRWSGHVVRDIEHCAHGISVNLGGSCLKKTKGKKGKSGANECNDGEPAKSSSEIRQAGGEAQATITLV